MRLLLFLPLAQAIIRGINFFGLETEHMDFMCTWDHPIDWHVSKIKELNFSHIRVPFSHDYIHQNDWKVLDEFFDAAERHDLKITLDFHRLEKTHQSAKPYNDQVTFDMFLEAWRTILQRYVSRPSLEAVDCFNEYQGDNWVEWNNLARQIISYIETNFPNRFLFYVGGTQWGGNLQFVNLTDMACHDRIIYSIHKYPFSDHEPFESAWNISFGPFKPVVNIGEFGFKSDQNDQVAWARRFLNWLLAQNIRDSYFWTYTWNSGDTGGILLEDCTTVDELKMALLHQFWNA